MNGIPQDVIYIYVVVGVVRQQRVVLRLLQSLLRSGVSNINGPTR